VRLLLAHFKKLDWQIIVCVFLITGIGLLSLYSSSLGRDDFSDFKKQIIFLGIGIFLMVFVSFFDWRIFRENSYLILILYFICLASLIGLFFFAPEIRGVKSWYKIGNISIDPIEFTKIILVILLAKYFSTRHTELYRVYHIILSGIYVLLPAALVFFQPDLGSALILIFLWVAILLVSGIRIKHFLILTFCGLLILVFSWIFLLKDYQKERIISFIEPQFSPLGAGWSQSQTKIAIGSGGLLGQGIGKGSQTQHGFLPEPKTDFIFAAVAEEMGLVGVTVLLFLFSILIWRIFKIAINSEDNFIRLFSFGFSVILMVQIFINISMNLGLLPVIGIPLPLVSYGGSSLISIFIALGILLNIQSDTV